MTPSKPNVFDHDGLDPISIASGKARVTDPCYTRGTGGVHVIDVLPGVYHASYMFGDEGRVAEVAIVHSDYNRSDLRWSEHLETAGVDSGQCGFADDEQYPSGDSTGEFEDEESFYGRVCKGTLSEKQAAELPFAVFTSTGYGDGSYPVYYAMDEERRVVGLALVFMWDEQEDDDGEDYGLDEDDDGEE
jgi:hypothetical protein